MVFGQQDIEHRLQLVQVETKNLHECVFGQYSHLK